MIFDGGSDEQRGPTGRDTRTTSVTNLTEVVDATYRAHIDDLEFSKKKYVPFFLANIMKI